MLIGNFKFRTQKKKVQLKQKRNDAPLSAEIEDTLKQKSIQEVDLTSGLKAEESFTTNTSTNITTIFGRTGRLSWDRIRDQEGKKHFHFFSFFPHR